MATDDVHLGARHAKYFEDSDLSLRYVMIQVPPYSTHPNTLKFRLHPEPRSENIAQKSYSLLPVHVNDGLAAHSRPC